MAVNDSYSNRNQKPFDSFNYSLLSQKMKNQAILIWQRFFNQMDNDSVRNELWAWIYNMICETHGHQELVFSGFGGNWSQSYEVKSYLEANANVEECLDVIEFVFRAVSLTPELMQSYHQQFRWPYKPAEAIEDLNIRFKQNGFGFEFVDGRIIRIDNNLLHKEIVTKTIQLLTSEVFKNANDEFMIALDHFRFERYKECMVECLKSFETTMKIICHENGWHFNRNATANTLIEVCRDNKLFPELLMNHYNSLISMIIGGIAAPRNQMAGHGQGPTKVIVPDYFASYVIYLTGTNINFLISCHKELNSSK